MSVQSGYLRQVSFNINVRCPSIISMHQMGGNGFLSYVDDCVYWCTSEALGNLFVDNLVNRSHVNFLVYAH